jgi:hypothetical protein
MPPAGEIYSSELADDPLQVAAVKRDLLVAG